MGGPEDSPGIYTWISPQDLPALNLRLDLLLDYPYIHPCIQPLNPLDPPGSLAAELTWTVGLLVVRDARVGREQRRVDGAQLEARVRHRVEVDALHPAARSTSQRARQHVPHMTSHLVVSHLAASYFVTSYMMTSC